MLRFFLGRGQHLSADRLKQQKDLFAFNKTNSHGFPYLPTCMAYDNELNLLAIGTRSGFIHLVGAPGVELTAQHEQSKEIKQIHFIDGRGQLVTLTEDYCLHLWEINTKEESKSVSPATTPTEEENAGTDKPVVNKYSVLEKVKTNTNFSKENRDSSLKDVTTIAICSSTDSLYIGTSSGNVYIIDLKTFEQSDQVIYQDVAIQNINNGIASETSANENEPGKQRVNPGSVEAIAPQPNNPDKVLIGYEKGFMVLWDNKNLTTERTFSINQQLESIHWQNDGEKFVSAHNDGSHIIWHVGNEARLPSESSKTIYGPFPCKPIRKIVWKTVDNDEDIIIFTGGMPRAAYGLKHTVSIIQGSPETGKHCVLDLTSKIIDFIVIDENGTKDNPQALIVLAEEEIIAIDLRDPDWLQYQLPYFCTVHSSVITCSEYYRNVPNDIIEILGNAEREKNVTKLSARKWPINGGQFNGDLDEEKDILITGHEDGGIRFWLAGENRLQHLHTLSTTKLFISMDEGIAPIDGDDIPPDEADGDDSEWPPFRKVGIFDPFSDDVRFSIKKLLFVAENRELIVGGTAGQVIIFKLNDEKVEKPLTVVTSSIVTEADGFVWKGCTKLTPTNGNIKFDEGFQPKAIVQLLPPASITALASTNHVHSLYAFGTGHGFSVYDGIQNKVILSKCTIKVIEPENVEESTESSTAVSRRRSFRKSLRESFRRLRRRRTQSADQSSSGPSSPSKESGTKSPVKSDSDPSESIDKRRTIERSFTIKPVEDSHPSVVRCLHFTKACLANNSGDLPSLWIGTNSGLIYVYSLAIPEGEEKRSNEEVKCELAKEIQLKHRAPVIFIQVIDANGNPVYLENIEEKKPEIEAPSTAEKIEAAPATVEEPTETQSPPATQPETSEQEKKEDEKPTETAPSAPVTQPSTSIKQISSKVIVCSEEQFKLFNLPTFKPYCKSKIAVHNVTKVRKAAVVTFTAKSDPRHSEKCITALVSDGDLLVLTINDLRKQIQTKLLNKDEYQALLNAILVDNGDGLYLQSPCQYQRFTLSACNGKPKAAHICIPEGVRPVVEPVEKPEEKVEAVVPVPVESEVKPEEPIAKVAPVNNESEVTAETAEKSSTDEKKEKEKEKEENKSKKKDETKKESHLFSFFAKDDKHKEEKKTKKDKKSKEKEKKKEEETETKVDEKNEVKVDEKNEVKVDEKKDVKVENEVEPKQEEKKEEKEADAEKKDDKKEKEDEKEVKREKREEKIDVEKSVKIDEQVEIIEKTSKLEIDDKEPAKEEQINGHNKEIIETETVTQTVVSKQLITETIEQKTSTPIKATKITSTQSTTTNQVTKTINGEGEEKNGLLDSSVISDITDTHDMSLDSVKDYMNNLNLNDTMEKIKEEVIPTPTPVINTNED